MTAKSNYLELVAISAFFILLCVLGIAWAIASGLLTSGIDGIMLLFVCLMMAGIFALMILLLLMQAGMIPSFGKSKSKAAAPAAKPAAPASQPAPQGK
jgi:TRAP-type C4-dicarboxylate transport system permease small subunit